MPRRTVTLVVAASLLVACGSDGDGASPTTIAPSTTTTLDEPAGLLDDQFDQRYCEVLTVTIAESGSTGEVWGTQGLNDCPQEAFAAIDTAAVAADMSVTLAVANGPRHWVLDTIVANEVAGSGETRDFGGLEMRSIAVVDLGPGVPDRAPYGEISVVRDTEFRFDAGREVHELTAPDGSIYVMQSYSLEVDPTLDVDALSGIGARLQLPEGWTFTSRVLTEPLLVEDIDGIATVIQDDLLSSYQLRARG
ncbi:MAG: hypothetical protein ACSLFP_15145 [Acidimicrobiales bacterium]